MRHRQIRSPWLTTLAIASVCLLTLSGVAPATASPADPPPPEDALALSLSGRIADAAEAGITNPDELSEAVNLPDEGDGSLIFESDGDLVATLHLSAPLNEELRTRIQQFAEIITEFPTLGAITVSVAPEYLDDLSELSGVLAVLPDAQPANNSGSSTLRHTTDPLIPATCTPQPAAEAATPLRVDLARTLSGADGTGASIGIISDSFNVRGGWDADITAGALPGPGNPCGRTTPIELLIEGSDTGSDEGRAMAQLMHTTAPGATILFASPTQASELGMAEAIATLIEHGATIIVDDLTLGSELFYQQGIISSTITQAQNLGVSFFTSAGNSNALDTTGAPVSAWSTDAYRPTPCPEWIMTEADTTPLDCLDFNPDPAVATPYDTLTIRNTGVLKATGGIAEAFLDAPTTYSVQYYRVDPNTPNTPPTLIADLVKIHPKYPVHSGTVAVNRGDQILQVMVRYTENPDPTAPLPAVTLGHVRGGELIASRTFMGNGSTDRVGASLQGHNGDRSAVSVASADWSDPTELRWFSSIGPRSLQFEAVTFPAHAPKPRLDSPIIVDGPNIVTVDGVATTFFGAVDEDGTSRFYGTSAAAPIAAAVAALGQQVLGVRGASLEQAVIASGRSTAQGGTENPYAKFGFSDAQVFGTGLIDACALLNLAEAPGAECSNPNDNDTDTDTDAGGDSGAGNDGAANGNTSDNGTGSGAGTSGSAGSGTDTNATSHTNTAPAPLANTGGSSPTGWIVGGAVTLTAVAVALLLLARRKKRTPQR